MKPAEHIFIIRRDETVLTSWLRDASTFALIVGLIGAGWILDSTPMEWAGFLIAAITIIARGSNIPGKYKMTCAEAREKIDALE